MDRDLEALKAAATKQWGHKGNWMIGGNGRYIWTWGIRGSTSISLLATFSVKGDSGVRLWSVSLNKEDGILDTCLDLDTLFHNLKIIVINYLRNKLSMGDSEE